MIAPAIIRHRRCKVCLRNKPEATFYRVNDTEGSICGTCGDYHEQALMFFATGTPPKGCQRCELTFEQLRTDMTVQDETVKTGMYLHMKDGVYQILCRKCSDWYSARCGMYENTPFEHKRKLKGYK